MEQKDQRVMNAVTLEMLVHLYYSPEDYVGMKKGGFVSESTERASTFLIRQGLIEHVGDEEYGRLKRETECPSRLKITEKGRVYIDAVLSTPLPSQAWKVVYPETVG